MEVNLDISYLPYQTEVFFETKEKFTIITKGRRVGITRGAAHAFIEYALDKITPLLWVDTVNGNIDRYYDRYFYPILKQLPKDSWSFNSVKKEMKIYDSVIDFRSAERPETIEGFGYKKIFLNEAGIILSDDYLYTNAILPMLLDYSDSQLIAAGVPKGKKLKNGNTHKFFELAEKAIDGQDNFKYFNFSSYTNPLLKKEDILELENEIPPNERDQEIYGIFVDKTGNNPFAYNYDIQKHESELAVFMPGRQWKISFDFNLNPFGCIFFHLWRDEKGEHLHVFDEMSIEMGNIPVMIDRIKERYGAYLHLCEITGDDMGNRRSMSERDFASLYDQLLRGLKLNKNQLKLAGNPTHENSRSDVNYILFKFPDFKINPKTCKNTITDMRMVQCDAFGAIMKKNRNDLSQRADHLDCVRYAINTFLKKWVLQNRKF